MGAMSITAPMTAVFFIGLLALWHYEYNYIYGTLRLLLIYISHQQTPNND